MRRALLTLVMSAGLLWAAAVPAGAGGPTSVLVASPGQAAATALYYTDPRYSELEGLLHGPGSEIGETGQPAADTYFTLTWLVHDVTPWRIDSLALDESGGAWLATRMDTIGEEVGAEVGEGDETWTRLSDGQQIRRLIGSLGLLGHGKAARGGDREVPVPMDVIDPAVEEGNVVVGLPEVREETRWFSLAGWRWLVPGVLLGAVLGGLPRRRGGHDEPPRQDLVDRAPESAGATY